MPRRRPRVERAIRKNDVTRLLRALSYHDAVADNRGRLIDIGEPVRVSAARGLAKIETTDGAAVDQALVSALGDRAPRVRQAAAQALAIRDARGSVSVLASAAAEWQGQYEIARRAALTALADLAGPAEMPHIVQILATRACSPGDAGDIFGSVLASKNVETRQAAGAAAAKVLVDGGPPEVARAAEMLLALGSSSLEPLLAIARGQDTARRHAIPVLARLGDRRAVLPLCDALDDQDVTVRRAAANALGELADPSARPALRAAIDDDDYEVRKAALSALNQLGPVPEPTYPDEMRSGTSRRFR